MLLRGLQKWCFHRAHSKTKRTSFNSTTADVANLLINKLHLESNIVFLCRTVAELLTGRSVRLSWNSLSELLCQLWMTEAVRSDWATGSPPWFLTVLHQTWFYGVLSGKHTEFLSARRENWCLCDSKCTVTFLKSRLMFQHLIGNLISNDFTGKRWSSLWHSLDCIPNQ